MVVGKIASGAWIENEEFFLLRRRSGSGILVPVTQTIMTDVKGSYIIEHDLPKVAEIYGSMGCQRVWSLLTLPCPPVAVTCNPAWLVNIVEP